MINFLRKKIDAKLILILAVLYAIISAVSFFKITYFKLKGYNYIDSEWKDLIINFFIVDYIAVMVFITFASMTTKYMIEQKLSWARIISIHLLLSFLIGFFVFFGSAFVFVIIGKISIHQINLESYLNGIIRVLDLNFLIYFSMVLTIYAYYYLKRVRETEREKIKLENQLVTVKLNLLKSNLQPHFLFNTLNSISSLIETNTKQAQNTIADLGGLLRDLLDTKDQNLTTLEKELNTLVKYINILEVRFSDHFSFASDIDDELLQTQFPNLLLQPIIENSIKHGYSYNNTDLEVYLSIEKEDHKIIVNVSNNGKLLPDDFSISNSNIGLSNTIERLESIYGNNFEFDMRNKKDLNGVITHISIPYIATKKLERPTTQTHNSSQSS